MVLLHVMMINRIQLTKKYLSVNYASELFSQEHADVALGLGPCLVAKLSVPSGVDSSLVSGQSCLLAIFVVLSLVTTLLFTMMNNCSKLTAKADSELVCCDLLGRKPWWSSVHVLEGTPVPDDGEQVQAHK